MQFAGHEIARHAPRHSNAVHRSALFSSCNRDKTVSDTARIRLPVRRVRRRIRFAPCADRLQSDSCDSICAVKPLCRKARPTLFRFARPPEIRSMKMPSAIRATVLAFAALTGVALSSAAHADERSEEHTSELQSRQYL